MSDGLPEGWGETPFSELIGELRNGISTRPNLEPPGTPILRISATRPGAVALDERRYLPKGDVLLNSYGLREKDLLFTRYNGSIELLGVCGMVRGLNNEPLLYPDKLMRVRLREHVAPEFIEAFFQSRPARQAIMALAKSSAGQQGISGSDLKEQIVRLAPLPEQHRIVEKVEALLEQVNRAKARLDRVPLILKRFRQAVLAAACSGELTREWREDRGIVVQWDNLALSQLIVNGPQNGLYKPQTAYGQGIGIVRIDDFHEGRLLRPWAELRKLSVTHAELKTYGLRNGDLLINRVNSPKFVGKPLLVDDLHEPAIFESNMMRLTLDQHRIDPGFAILVLLSPQGKEALQSNAKHAVNQSSINQGDVGAVRVPLPGRDEQRAIREQVAWLFALADTIERRVQAATARANKLPQAILSKAFSGELVPTEAELARLEGRTYETAEELLKRVTALGSDAPSARKGRGRRTG